MNPIEKIQSAFEAIRGKLGPASVHCGHVTFAETEEWPSIDINVRLAVNREVSGPMSRWLCTVGNPASIQALLEESHVEKINELSKKHNDRPNPTAARCSKRSAADTRWDR